MKIYLYISNIFRIFYFYFLFILILNFYNFFYIFKSYITINNKELCDNLHKENKCICNYNFKCQKVSASTSSKYKTLILRSS